MKLTLFIIMLVSSLLIHAEEKKTKFTLKDDYRQLIGSVMNPPILFGDNLYLLSTAGTLFKANKQYQDFRPLFQTKLPTMSGILIVDGVAYFGEGLHDHKKSHLYAYDLKLEKLIWESEVQGHVERTANYFDNVLIVGAGEAGLIGLNAKDGKILWQFDKIGKNKIHVDSTPLLYQNQVCTSSIYHFKGVFCISFLDQKLTMEISLPEDPKSELTLEKDFIVGYATSANMIDAKWLTPSQFFVIDLKSKKIQSLVKLRGFNFFRPLIHQNKAFVSLSSGDLLWISLQDGLIEYVSEFPEPFLSSSVLVKNDVCTVASMGQLFCFSKGKEKWEVSKKKRYFETVIGNITKFNDQELIVPSRVGHFVVNLSEIK